MTAQFIVRVARAADRPILVSFMEALQEAERELCANRTIGAEIADPHLAYLEQLAAKQQGRIYVAESQADLLGFVVCFVDKLDDGDRHVTPSERSFGYISDLYVIPTLRKYGVGAALMAAAEQHFRELGLTVVRVSLLSSNEPAARFYSKVGYQPYEILYEKRFDRT
ncbi:GNAT family N-acetyltransferase [Leptolyngbya ohadii]|uniref:GNAT family N-acetyltransferase n=1 Tax=Leptolyngbya ohadii TaxID=1962290 RepID=UPI000B59CF88|nr:GNAT family N-acetyltransferase [Leptolyngbya ohadii]